MIGDAGHWGCERDRERKRETRIGWELFEDTLYFYPSSLMLESIGKFIHGLLRTRVDLRSLIWKISIENKIFRCLITFCNNQGPQRLLELYLAVII